MHCNDARQLMLAVLDEESSDAGALASHMESCPACANEWHRLSEAESLLRSQGLEPPPPGLAGRVTAALPEEARRPPVWQRRAMELAWVVTGVLVMASAVVSLLPTWHAVLADPRISGLREFAMGVLSAALLVLVDTGVLLWPLYGLLAVAMAIFWFGAIIVPLHTRRLVRSRA